MARAVRSQRTGQGFESPQLHQFGVRCSWKTERFNSALYPDGPVVRVHHRILSVGKTGAMPDNTDMEKSLQAKALEWCEANATHWAVFNRSRFSVEWVDGDVSNWIDDQSQPPFKYRVAHKTAQALALLKHLGITQEECRF